MPRHDISNLHILAAMMDQFPGERAVFYRKALVIVRYDDPAIGYHTAKLFGTKYRGHYEEYFRTGGYYTKESRYVGVLWNRDPADMKWYLTAAGIEKAQECYLLMNERAVMSSIFEDLANGFCSEDLN